MATWAVVLIGIYGAACTLFGHWIGRARQARDSKVYRGRQRSVTHYPLYERCRWVLSVPSGSIYDRDELVGLIRRRFPYFTLEHDDVEVTPDRG